MIHYISIWKLKQIRDISLRYLHQYVALSWPTSKQRITNKTRIYSTNKTAESNFIYTHTNHIRHKRPAVFPSENQQASMKTGKINKLAHKRKTQMCISASCAPFRFVCAQACDCFLLLRRFSQHVSYVWNVCRPCVWNMYSYCVKYGLFSKVDFHIESICEWYFFMLQRWWKRADEIAAWH